MKTKQDYIDRRELIHKELVICNTKAEEDLLEELHFIDMLLKLPDFTQGELIKLINNEETPLFPINTNP